MLRPLAKQFETLRHNAIVYLMSLCLAYFLDALLPTASSVPLFVGITYVFSNVDDRNLEPEWPAFLTGALLVVILSLAYAIFNFGEIHG